tara:strand:+ start:1322 stop:2449 length:1128 start_codon:yes stop_codon:yes gene_type:complete
MKILHIITGLNKGGAETLLCNLCQFDKEHEHEIISLSYVKDSQSLSSMHNFSIHSLNFPVGKIRIFGLFKLYKLIKKIKPDAIQTWLIHADLIGGIAARFSGIKNIFWGVHHTILLPGKVKFSTIFVLKCNAFLSNFVPKKIIYCAEKSRQIQESIGFNKSKGLVIQNGYDIKNFSQNDILRKDFRNELGCSNNTFLIGHVGSYHPLKDQSNLIDALAFLNKKGFNYSAVLVGKDLDHNNDDLVCKIRENELTDHIFLLGERNDIPAVMNGIDLFVLSSISEAFPNVLNEAMACGTPCVTTNVGDASLIVDNTGWVVSPKDPKAIANAVFKAVDEKQSDNLTWVKRKNECHKRIADHFTLEKMLKKYKEAWASND